MPNLSLTTGPRDAVGEAVQAWLAAGPLTTFVAMSGQARRGRGAVGGRVAPSSAPYGRRPWRREPHHRQRSAASTNLASRARPGGGPVHPRPSANHTYRANPANGA